MYLALYQGLTNYNEDKDAYKEFSRDFFDLVVVDECHRGSAAADGAWREILSYFGSATQNGKMRYGLLDGEIFYSLLEARVIIERWRMQYNTIRPHSSLGGKPPAPQAIEAKLT